jgi:anti-sigma B factor antagonist
MEVMEVEERAVGSVTILDLKGKLTFGDGDLPLKSKAQSLIQQGRKQLILNLAAVPYVDSAGIGELVETFTTVSRSGGSLKLLNPTRRVHELLTITKLLTVFESFTTESDAIRSFPVTV